MTTASAAVLGPDVAVAEHPSPLVAYADLPSRWAVSVERLADGVRVVVPPVPSWRRLGAGFFVGGAILAVFLAIIVAASYGAGEWAPLVFNGIPYGGGLLWVILAARYRLRRRIALEVTGATVSATYLTGRRGVRRMEWPREKVAEIKLNSSSGKLIVRVAGVAFVELYLGPNRELNAYVAETLAGALREPLRARPVDPAPEDDAAQAPADVGTTGPSRDGVRSRTTRRWLLAAAAVMAVGGGSMMFFEPPLGPPGFYLLLFAAAPVGIAMGTQDKDFYV